MVYSDPKTGKVYGKKCVIDKFIKEKDYRICPEGCRLELITPRPNAIYECKIDTPVKAKQVQELNLSTLPDRSPRAGGALIFTRKLMKITFMKYLDGTEETNEPTLLPESELLPDPVETVEEPPVTEKEISAEKKTEKLPAKEKSPSKGKKASGEADDKTSGDDDENWGILQPDLGF